MPTVGARWHSALVAVVLGLIWSWPALAYEAELAALTKKLVMQLESNGQKSAAVVDFTDLQGATTELGRFLAQELSDQMVSSSKKLSVVDRATLQTLLRENKLSMDGLVDSHSAQKLGNLIGIDTVVSGTTTPIGNKIRLSVRAVSVETSKVVGSQAVNLPTDDGLRDLYDHGVSTGSAGGQQAAKPTAPDPRARFRNGSIKLIGREAVIGGRAWYTATATFSLENASGVGIEAALRRGVSSIGSCVGQDNQSTGLNFLTDQGVARWSNQPTRETAFQYLPAGAKINVTIELGGCQPTNFTGQTQTNASVSLVIKQADGNDLIMPLSASNIPLRFGEFRY